MLSVTSRLTNCATRVCCACLDEITCVAVMYLILRIGCSRGRTPKVVRPQQRKNPLPYSFSQRSPLYRYRRALEGKVGVQRGRETMGVPSSLLPRRVPQSPTASAAVPRCATAHSSPRNGEPFTRFGHTGKSVPRNLRSKSARRSALLTFSLVQCRKMRYTFFI